MYLQELHCTALSRSVHQAAPRPRAGAALPGRSSAALFHLASREWAQINTNETHHKSTALNVKKHLTPLNCIANVAKMSEHNCHYNIIHWMRTKVWKLFGETSHARLPSRFHHFPHIRVNQLCKWASSWRHWSQGNMSFADIRASGMAVSKSQIGCWWVSHFVHDFYFFVF